MFCSQKCNELHQLVPRKGIAKGWHFLAAIFNLIRQLSRRHRLAHVGQRRTLGSAGSSWSVAIGAAFVSEQSRSRRFGLFGNRGSY